MRPYPWFWVDTTFTMDKIRYADGSERRLFPPIEMERGWHSWEEFESLGKGSRVPVVFKESE